MSTYHDMEDGWYFQLPEVWLDRVLAGRSTTADEAVVTFYIREGRDHAPEPFLSITAITGADRETRAVRGGRFTLSRKAETIYTAELLAANEAWNMASGRMTCGPPSLIPTEWAEGEN